MEGQGSSNWREAAAQCGTGRKRNKKVHVGAAVMPDYLNAHHDPYSAILNRGNINNTELLCAVCMIQPYRISYDLKRACV